MYNDDRFKFRFWHKSKNSYLNTEKLVLNDGTYTQVGTKQMNNGTYYSYIVNEYNTFEIIAEQCTGLKDSNNKLIYENDIVKNFNGDYYLVVWDTNSYLLKCKDGDKLLTDPDYLEVIGNIHENTELLENVK